MTPRPVSLNKAVALLFITGSALFALGSVPAYLKAVGETADSVTYFVGSIFFTSASFAQLLQAQTPAMTEVDAESQHTRTPVRFQAWLPHDRNWLAAATFVYTMAQAIVAADKPVHVYQLGDHYPSGVGA